MKKRNIILGILLTILGLVACDAGGTIGPPARTPIPTAAIRTQPNPTRPALLIQYCDDDTGSYNHTYFRQANRLIASSLAQGITANQKGVTLYATAITHNTFDPVNTLAPAFDVPPIEAYGVPPTPIPTHAPQNPVTDPPTETAIQNKTAGGMIAYNNSVAVIDKKIETAKGNITKDGGRLIAWNPPVDTVATSVLGCFQLAATRFQDQSDATKLIYIASDLENNTDVDYTQDFVKKRYLAGVIVHVIYVYSPNASRDQQKRAQWCSFLKSAGAKAVLFSDPAVAGNLIGTDMFDTDLTTPAQTCA